MTYVVYILQSLRSGKFYVGQTYNLEKRLTEHNSETAGFTKNDQPWKVIWQLEVTSRKQAVKLEKKIKKRGAKRFLTDINFQQPD